MSLLTARSSRVAAARRLTRRARRDEERRFLAEGPQAVREALRVPPGSPGSPEALLGTASAFARHTDLADAAAARGTPALTVDDAGMAGLSETATPQGLVAVCGFLDTTLDVVLADRPHLVAVLTEIRDPGNAGTVLRTADAAGADAVVFSESSVDPYNGKCVRATAGSLFHLAVVRDAPAERTLDLLRRAGLRVLAADGSGEHDLDALADTNVLAEPTAWMFGNEAHGLPTTLAASADMRVRVPVHGRAESLNLAAAAAVCLYASARAQRGPTRARDAGRNAMS